METDSGPEGRDIRRGHLPNVCVGGTQGISSSIGRGEIRWNGREPRATLN